MLNVLNASMVFDLRVDLGLVTMEMIRLSVLNESTNLGFDFVMRTI